MSASGDPPVTLVRIGTTGSRRRASLAVTLSVAALASLVAVGALGGGAEPAPDPGRSPRTVARATRAPSSPSDTAPAGAGQAGDASVRRRVVAVARSGYEVTYERDASHRPIVLDDGRLAIFGYGERVLNGAYPGTVHVAVGTPVRGAPVSGDGDLRRVYGATLEDLERDYRSAVPITPVASRDGAMGPADARLLEFADGRWVALAAYGNRSYVLTATGFTLLYPDAVQPARAGLEAFLANFRLTGTLFVSRALGFEAPLPVPGRPFGVAPDGETADTGGLFVFDAGSELRPGVWSHAIGVSVGSEANPALVEVLPGSAAPPDPTRIWADSLVGLQSAYHGAIDGKRGSSTTIRLSGELALLVEGPNGLAAAVLAVRRGRAYIISTTGTLLPEIAPQFEAFLEGFAFLDPP